MPRTKLQTLITINNTKVTTVDIERRRKGMPKPDEVGSWYTIKTYTPTMSSVARLEAVACEWVNRGDANIKLQGCYAEFEITCE